MDTRLQQTPAIATAAAPPDIPESPVEGDGSRAIITRRTSYPRGHHIKPHWHARAQFVFAVAGTMRVRTARHAWIVPPSRALWVPAHTAHEIQMYGVVEMHSLYVADAACAGMPASCVVLSVTPLLRELVVRAVALPALRHRVLINFEGEAEQVNPDTIVGELIAGTPTE